MKIKKLRQIEVSEIGMGCMGFSHGYGNAPERAYNIRAIQEAYCKNQNLEDYPYDHTHN